ncbi:hypothetical protein LEM8419_00876 [Neolewinella maritima]|uniref:SUI1 domain-containing protein n=1 Tax=Neolewinella maritima TaxID=1383882 RepID=A0ABM9AYJ3_9BACT|nr:translation initiation factor [Neolewinella maritima]CAH0999576.1 hypothetical protein LEM8419_00876 [Neolewinella maritima]
MAKKNYAPKQPVSQDNPFAALSRLTDLPPPPKNLPDQSNTEGGDAGATMHDALRVQVDRKYRRGKAATLVTGFTGPDDVLQALGKSLKVQCGVGGSVKDGTIIIQGDQRERVIELLLAEGYVNTKRSGG